uniref:Heavy metal-binding protein HIP-like n=1 Tax=Crassostrea virginica TaxID=6565 RepID=A0A8B8DB40_CRAVI|nr:heavy metal-binding protein HIP-like [Crassostrea virginica]
MVSTITICNILGLQLMLVLGNNSIQDNQNAMILRKLSELEEEVSMLKEKIKSCTTLDAASKERRIVPQGEHSHVAFQVHLSHNLQSLGLHQAILFDSVVLNEGGGYSVHSGEFVAPVSGLYVFSWTISAGDRTCTKYDIVKNSAVLMYFISDAYDHDDWDSSSGTVVTRMNSGDRVWLRIADMLTCSHWVFGIGYGTSSFSGFLLH